MDTMSIVRAIITVASFSCFVAWLVWFLKKDNHNFYQARATELLEDARHVDPGEDRRLLAQQIERASDVTPGEVGALARAHPVLGEGAPPADPGHEADRRGRVGPRGLAQRLNEPMTAGRGHHA